MRFGIGILPQQPWATARRLWQTAEELGFDHAWTYDHLSWRSLANEPWGATIPTLTATATMTSRTSGIYAGAESVLESISDRVNS